LLSWASCLSEASIVIKWSLLAILLACVKEWVQYTDRRRDNTNKRRAMKVNFHRSSLSKQAVPRER
jgi:hypothetical protein